MVGQSNGTSLFAKKINLHIDFYVIKNKLRNFQRGEYRVAKPMVAAERGNTLQKVNLPFTKHELNETGRKLIIHKSSQFARGGNRE